MTSPHDLQQAGAGEPDAVAHLRAAAAACDTEASGARLAGDRAVLVWARDRLVEVSAVLRELAAALCGDPTLATEPVHSGRFRVVDLVIEMARQLPIFLRQASVPEDSGGRGSEAGFLAERRAEADAMADRLVELATGAARLVPRRDSTTVAGAREISRRRLTTHSPTLQEAAALLRDAAEAALAVEHPDPVAVSLAAMAVQLRAHHTELEDWATRYPEPANQLLTPPTAPGTEDATAPDRDDDDDVDCYATAGTVLSGATPGTALATTDEQPRGDEDAEPDWAREVIDTAARWLHTAYTSANTKKAHANALGIPRADQRLWRGEPTHRNVLALPEATAFFPWCAAAGLNPLTDMTRDALRTWLTVQDAAGVSANTRKARLGAVAAWYREMRARGATTFEVAAALPATERRNLGVLKPEPEHPTVPLTLGQARALRYAAETYPVPDVRLRYRVIVAILTTTGIRAEELCALNRRDLHRAGPNGKPALWINGKGRKRRWVLVVDWALAMIDEYLADRDAAEATSEIAVRGQVSAKTADRPLLTSRAGNRLEPQQITDTLQYLCRSLLRRGASSSTIRVHAAAVRAIADTIHPHAARHLYAIAAEAHGIPLRQISLDLGHATLATTEAYLEQAHQLADSAAPTLADLITAGENPSPPADQGSAS
ncbi:tyrosine-type recombinase/integrase [Amycolatopsis sp. NPDC051903]|uniref:tyrosine-type recombinase/integrase n=1 Tax=Amycolatopsis sp. NPDC051903 TaxID=3363936 RepID=UPI0037AC8CD8